MAGALAGTAACDDTTGPVANDLNGDWLVIRHVESVVHDLECRDTAQVRVQQTDAVLAMTGAERGACRVSADVWWARGDDVDVRDGRIARDSSVSFANGDCRYHGSVAPGDQRITGTVTCRAEGDGVTMSGAWTMTRADFTPPTVVAAVGGATLSHGDTLRITVRATDDGQLAFVGGMAAYDGVSTVDCPADPPTERDSAAVGDTTAERAFTLVVPGCAGGIRVSGFAVDTAGNRTEAASEPVAFELPWSEVAGSLSDTVYTLGDTVRVDVTARNARGLAYVGYEWFLPNPAGRDSVEVSGSEVTVSLHPVLPHDAPPTQLSLTVFARHQQGWRTDGSVSRARTTDALRFPVQQLSMPGNLKDLAYAAGSDRVYVADPTASVVREVYLDPFGLGGTHMIPAPAVSLDLSVSGDSLLVALQGRLEVAVLGIGGGGTSITLDPPNTTNIYDARRIRVVGTGRAMIGVGSGSGGYVVDLDLTSGAQRLRVPWYGYGTFERAGDRMRVLFVDPTSPVGTRLYLAESDTFLEEEWGTVTLFGTNALISSDDAGTTWLVRCELFGADMDPRRTLSDPSAGFGPSAISSDAARAYCARRDGFVEFDVATGNRVRAVWLPAEPGYLRALPGRRVLAATGSTLYLVALPQ